MPNKELPSSLVILYTWEVIYYCVAYVTGQIPYYNDTK